MEWGFAGRCNGPVGLMNLSLVVQVSDGGAGDVFEFFP